MDKTGRTSIDGSVMSGVMIADEMGLGKTVQALAVLGAANAYPALIVCPASLKLNWQREARKWLPGTTVEILGGTRPGIVPDFDIAVINYDVLSSWVGHLPPLRALVLDEAHYIKSAGAIRTKAAIQLSDNMTPNGLRVCLTGTPVMNAPGELLTQLRFMQRLDDFGGARDFKDRYGRGKHLSELNRRLRATCFVRRRKTDVLTELPPKRWSEVLVEGDPTIMRDYRKAELDIVTFLAERARQAAEESGATTLEARQAAADQAIRAQAAEHLVAITALKRLAARAKMPAVREWIEDFKASGSKLVAFAHHTEIVNILTTEFADGCAVGGGASNEDRQSAVDRFQSDEGQTVIACSLKAAGVGLTLTAASDVLFVEQGWTPADMDQASDRCHRIGQTDSVTAWNMIAAGTIDEDIAALIANKRMVVDAITDGVTVEGNEPGSILSDLLVRLSHRGE